MKPSIAMSDAPRADAAALSAEADALLAYLLGSGAPAPLRQRYLRAPSLAGARAIGLPPIVHRHPWMLRFLEAPLKPRSARQQLLRQRLDMATVLCETSPAGQDLLWRDRDRSRTGVLARLLGELVLDALAMPARLVAALAWK